METLLEPPVVVRASASRYEQGACIPNIEYDDFENPVWYTTEEVFHEIGNMLVARYGETIRNSLDQSLVAHNLCPLP